MVLQRGMNITIQGGGEAGTKLKLRLQDQVKTTSVTRDGRWTITLDRMQASLEPTELTITAGESTVVLRDIVVGDVWLCSGQSNMGFKLASCTGGKEAAKAANDPLLRVNNYRDTWKPCIAETATLATFRMMVYIPRTNDRLVSGLRQKHANSVWHTNQT